MFFKQGLTSDHHYHKSAVVIMEHMLYQDREINGAGPDKFLFSVKSLGRVCLILT